MANYQALYDFIDRALKSRKYPSNTAMGLKAALKLFEEVINEDEKKSVDNFKNNLNQIYRDVSSKNGKTFSAGSLATYKSRVLKVINDFEQYGNDPTKMAGWTPRTRKVSKNNNAKQSEGKGNVVSDESPLPVQANMHKIELSLRPDAKFILVVPRDITKEEYATVKAILESLSPKN